MKKFKDCIEEQINIVAASELTMLFLKVYKNNPKEFYMLFDENIIHDYIGEYNHKNIDDVYEFCRGISEEIVSPIEDHFHMTSNGIFSYIEYSKKLDNNLLNDIYERFSPLQQQSWGITSMPKNRKF